MFAHPICNVISRLPGTFVSINDFGFQFGDEHTILTNLARRGHIGNVLDQKIGVANFEMKPNISKCKQVVATSD
jgi:hypothetical protein